MSPGEELGAVPVGLMAVLSDPLALSVQTFGAPGSLERVPPSVSAEPDSRCSALVIARATVRPEYLRTHREAIDRLRTIDRTLTEDRWLSLTRHRRLLGQTEPESGWGTSEVCRESDCSFVSATLENGADLTLESEAIGLSVSSLPCLGF
jgi:hypothetical protein